MCGVNGWREYASRFPVRPHVRVQELCGLDHAHHPRVPDVPRRGERGRSCLLVIERGGRGTYSGGGMWWWCLLRLECKQYRQTMEYSRKVSISQSVSI